MCVCVQLIIFLLIEFSVEGLFACCIVRMYVDFCNIYTRLFANNHSTENSRNTELSSVEHTHTNANRQWMQTPMNASTQ